MAKSNWVAQAGDVVRFCAPGVPNLSVGTVTYSEPDETTTSGMRYTIDYRGQEVEATIVRRHLPTRTTG